MADRKKTIKLHYFNARARAELIRVLFALAKVEFEDKRYTFDEWLKVKPTSPYGVMPFVEIDGKTLGGTLPIARYFAEEYGFAGKDAFENAQLLSAADCTYDIATPIFQHKMSSPEDKEKNEKAVREKVPGKLKFLSCQIKNGSIGGIVGNNEYGITWADLAVAGTVALLEKDFPDLLNEGCDALKAVRQKVINIKEVKDWINSRPVTEM